MLKTRIVRQPQLIAPFGEPAREACIGGQTLTELHDELGASLGLQIERVDEPNTAAESDEALLLWHDDLFVTRRALRSFIKRARSYGSPCRLALPDSLLMQRFAHLQKLPRDEQGRHLFDLWYLPKGLAAGALEMATALEPTYKEIQHPVPVPRHIVGFDHYLHPITTTIAMRIRHWVHILWANTLMPQVRLVEQITSRPLSTALRLLGSLGLSRNAMQARAMQRFSYQGKRCKIHPTARVELSVLGDDVEVGAFTLLRGAVLGSGTHVEERACVMFSSLGPRSFVSRNSTLILCGGYPDADLCVNGMQLALAGRETALTSFVRPMDMRYRQDTRVVDEGEVVALPGHMLGPCFGHGCFVGPDVAIASGRALPNGAVIVPPPQRALSRLPSDWPEGQIGVVKNGSLLPLETDRSEPKA